MKTLFKLLFFALVLAIVYPAAWFAWRMGQPMTPPEFKGLTYYQYAEWTRTSYIGVVDNPEQCFKTDKITLAGPFFTEGMEMILGSVLADVPFPDHPLQVWWEGVEKIQVGLLKVVRHPSCRIPTAIPDDYAISVGAKLPEPDLAEVQ